MEFKVGDKVKILDGNCMSDPDDVYWENNGMDEYVGLETFIVYASSFYYYLNIDQKCFSWASYWLEKVED